MATEKQCRLMVERLDEKIKKLQGEIDDRRILKKKWQGALQDLKWKAKNKKAAKRKA